MVIQAATVHSSTLPSLADLVAATSKHLYQAAEAVNEKALFSTAVRSGLVDAIGFYHDACELEHPSLVDLLLEEQMCKILRIKQVQPAFSKAECDLLSSAIKVCLSFGGGVVEAANTARGLQATLRYYGARTGSRIGPILALASHITLNRQVLL